MVVKTEGDVRVGETTARHVLEVSKGGSVDMIALANEIARSETDPITELPLTQDEIVTQLTRREKALNDWSLDNRRLKAWSVDHKQ